MYIKHSQQDIEINLPDNIKNIGMKISGGADSAIIIYILSKYVSEERPAMKIIPITTVHTKKAYQEIFAKQVIEFCKTEFGDIYGTHQVNWCEGEEDYVTKQVELTTKLYSDNIIDGLFTGITKNPPEEARQDFRGFPPSDRDVGIQPQNKKGTNRTSPLINIDKKGVRELYDYFGVLDKLFPLTRSCEHDATNFEKHCGKCWFCDERLWGFGSL